MNKNLRDTHVYLKEEDWKYLEERSQKEDLSVTQLIRKLIREKRLKHDKKETNV